MSGSVASNESQLLGAILRGVFVGATVGLLAKFVTDKENLKYAGSGALVGAIAFGALYAIKSK